MFKKLNICKIDKIILKFLRKVQDKPNTSQRALASTLGFSLGKLNYCLKALQKKGLVKIKNFQKKRTN